jgi:AcrR family transcriptional regulator
MVAGARAQWRRRGIVEAAVRVFGTRGYHRAGVPEIARELGVGYGTLYRYYPGKRDILVGVIAETFARIEAIVAEERPTAATSRAEYRAQVERIGHAMLRLTVDEPAMVRLTFVESLTVDEELTAYVLDTFTAMGAVTAAYLANGVDRGFLRADLDVATTAKVVNGAIWAAALSVSRAQDAAEEAGRWVRAISALMFDGLGGADPLPI